MRITEDDPDVVLVGDLGVGFTYPRLDAAFRCLMEGAELVALQKNRYWQNEGGLSLDAGPFVAALEYASEKRAVVVGKPEESFFRIALEDMGLEASAVAMVGDDAEAPQKNQVGLAHIALIADSFDTVKAMYQRLKAHDVPIVRTVDHGITKSVYFKDPEGNELEIYCEVPERPWQEQKTIIVADPIDLEAVSGD